MTDAPRPDAAARTLPTLGWKERGSLPDWGVPRLRMKLDTGARTSALHVEELEVVGTAEHEGAEVDVIRFQILVGSRDDPQRLVVTTPTVGKKMVRDTGANAEHRFVARTRIVCGPLDTVADVTVTDRSGMNFRMLLGRLTLAGHALVDPEHGYLQTTRPPRRIRTEDSRP